MKRYNKRNEEGSIELIVLGLLAALIVVLAIPLLKSIGNSSKDNQEPVKSESPVTPAP